MASKRVTFRWLASGFAAGQAKAACAVCASRADHYGQPTDSVGKVNFIDPIIWKDSIGKYGDKKGRQVAQRRIIAAWKAHMQEVHPARWETVVTR